MFLNFFYQGRKSFFTVWSLLWGGLSCRFDWICIFFLVFLFAVSLEVLILKKHTIFRLFQNVIEKEGCTFFWNYIICSCYIIKNVTSFKIISGLIIKINKIVRFSRYKCVLQTSPDVNMYFIFIVHDMYILDFVVY